VLEAANTALRTGYEVELIDGPPIDITIDTLPTYTQLPTAVLDTQATA
jgi:hypothetical protein